MRIADILSSRRPVFSFEFFPPKSDEAVKLLEKTITELRPLQPDFVSVTYGAGGSTRDRTIDITTTGRKTGSDSPVVFASSMEMPVTPPSMKLLESTIL